MIRGALLTALLFLVGYVWLLSDALLHADAAEYIDDMSTLGQMSHPVHFGYIATGHLFLQSAQLTGITPDFAMNLFNLFWGAFTLFFLYLTAFHLTGKKSVSTVACLVLAVNYSFVFNSVFAEIYIMQVGCLMAALFLYLRQWWIGSGILLSLAVLTTPLSLLALPLFITLDYRLRPLLTIGALVLAPLAIVVSVYPEYLGSGRFLMAAEQSFVIQRQAMIEFNDITNGYFAMIPALVAGCAILFRTEKLRRFNLGLGAMFFANFFLGERYYDVPGQLFTLCLLSIAAAAGLAKLLGKADAQINPETSWRWVAGIAAGSFVGAVLTGISIVVQRKMDGIPAFYYVAGIVIAVTWLLFTAVSRIAINKTAFYKQFMAIGVVLLLLFFNLKFTLGRTVEDKNIAEAQKASYTNSLATCGDDCWKVGNWNDVVLFLHYFGLTAKEDDHHTTARTLNGDNLQHPDEDTRTEFVKQLSGLVERKENFILFSRLPQLEDWLKQQGYVRHGNEGWECWFAPGKTPDTTQSKNP